ncbi:molybdopterin converting factor subunit 1 [Kurthia sibirica]|uniref:Molybdopterin synthase sulfur carrier subunit n=1 Tax=Kurthia sibirica TaxID=202750 RepID=A0A2U3AKS3_9BACL|nr:molybdopterin converting factor subunit 1 [Kurthia sibirica]PWI25114.1 molybdopterin converting factor subunit 1 [Kurthia sibirica]GEK34035.1 molybdopterin synthase sulfur carrier subunit [Kurthia sibirica]
MIEIFFFAHLQEVMGKQKLSAPLANQCVADVKKWLMIEYPLMSLAQVMSAVNEEFATDDTIVKEGDTIAFIPPISGG